MSQIPASIHQRLMANNPRYRQRVETTKKLRKQGKTPPNTPAR